MMSKYITDAVNTDIFEFFLIWLVREKGYEDAIFIIDVACNPHKYEEYYQEFYVAWNKEKDEVNE